LIKYRQDFSAQDLSDLETVTDFLRFAYSLFNSHQLHYGHGTDNSWDEAVNLVLGLLKLPWNADKSLLNSKLTKFEKTGLVSALQRRVVDRVPVPYITGESWFMGMPFEVSPDVLIPRSPLAELLLKRLEPWLGSEPTQILDLCCGSGCIGIGAARVFEAATVTVADISEPALNVARRNIDRHHLQDRIKIIKSDVWENIATKYDLILSNPPYVDAQDMVDLPAEYQHEPALGLAAGSDGLDITRTILAGALSYLLPGGTLVCEVGNSLSALLNHYAQVPFICPELEHGGMGVVLLTYEQLQACQNTLKY